MAHEIRLEAEPAHIGRVRLLTPRLEEPSGVWILLHGLSCLGIDHPMLTRLARALADSGFAVVLPEVLPWRDLDPMPPAADAAISSIADLIDDPLHEIHSVANLRTAPLGLIGLSFSAPQALIASRDPALRGRICRVVTFGAYCDLRSTLHFQFTGEHEHDGERLYAAPDPYGRWVLGGHLLRTLDGFHDAVQAAESLKQIAQFSSLSGLDARHPRVTALVTVLRETIPVEHRRMFDLLSGQLDKQAACPGDERRALADHLFEAATQLSDRYDVRPLLRDVCVPVVISHGRDDRLIPFSEASKLQTALRQQASAELMLTGLLAHSTVDRPQTMASSLRETFAFAKGLARALHGLETHATDGS